MGIERNKNTDEPNKLNLNLKQWFKGSLMAIATALVAGAVYTIYDVNVPEHKFTDLELAKNELSQNGITKSQRDSAYKYGPSEIALNEIYPIGYDKKLEQNLWMKSPEIQARINKYNLYRLSLTKHGKFDNEQAYKNKQFTEEVRRQAKHEAKKLSIKIGNKNKQYEVMDFFTSQAFIDQISQEDIKIDALAKQLYKDINTGEVFTTNISKQAGIDSIRNWISNYNSLAQQFSVKNPKLIMDLLFYPGLSGSQEFKLPSADNHIEREDLFRVYLGMPQVSNTMGISDVQPRQSTEDKIYYHLNKYKLHPSVFFRQIKASKNVLSEGETKTQMEILELTILNGISNDPQMAQFQIGVGRDKDGLFVSYFDIWDFEIGIPGVGRPFELYDRLHFDKFDAQERSEIEKVYNIPFEQFKKRIENTNEKLQNLNFIKDKIASISQKQLNLKNNKETLGVRLDEVTEGGCLIKIYIPKDIEPQKFFDNVSLEVMENFSSKNDGFENVESISADIHQDGNGADAKFIGIRLKIKLQD